MTKIVVGLGNPGKEYEKSRHNVGFHIIDAVAASYGASWHEKAKFKAQIAQFILHGETVILVKPETYYNLIGESIRALKDFYKVQNSDILAIHDELDLSFGTIRTRIGGGSAGNNGIKSILSHIGEDFARIRVGTANEISAGRPAEVFVLATFSEEEKQHLPEIISHAKQYVDAFIRRDQNFTHSSIKTK